MAESIQHRLSRIRPPRVQITYDVEIGNAIEKKELPFVVGVLADLSGKPAKPKPKVSDRKFVEIDRDNFNEVMSKIKPRLAFRVPNTLGGDGGDNLNVELEFENIDDFRPEQLVKQVPALKKLFEARQKLRDLLTKLDGNDELDALLADVVSNTEHRDQVREQLNSADGGDSGGEEAPAEET